MMSMKEALDIVLSRVKVLGREKVPLLSSLGRVLGEEIKADRNIPPFDRAAMDGFAVRAEDTKGAEAGNPVVLEVVEEIPAGGNPQKPLGKGEASLIMTGAPLPRGADSVVMVEDTQRIPNPKSQIPKVGVFKEVKPGENVSFQGEDVQAGEKVLGKGDLIGPAQLGMLASMGRESVAVFLKPRVSIIATGDELVELGQEIEEGEVRDCNSYALWAQAFEAGALPRRWGVVGDEEGELRRRIEEAKDCHFLILSGGVSVGKYDLVKGVLEDCGVKPCFWKVAIKPGKPVFFGEMGEVLVFGLPGYPVSSMVTFELLVRPAILKMGGRREIHRPRVRAVLEREVRKKKGRRAFLRTRVEYRGGRYYALPTEVQESSALKSMVLAQGLIVFPEEGEILKEGEEVEVILLEGDNG